MWAGLFGFVAVVLALGWVLVQCVWDFNEGEE